MIKAIIFDCFGVLITDVFNAMHEELRVRDPGTAKQVDAYVDDLNRGTLLRNDFMVKVGPIFDLSAAQLRTRIESKEAKNKAVFDYVREVRKKYKTAMLTNLSPEAFGRRFAPGELDEYLDVVVISGEIGYIKPEPEAYLITAEKLGVKPSECVMIDDRQVCIDGAQAVGMQAILYTSLAELKTALGTL